MRLRRRFAIVRFIVNEVIPAQKIDLWTACEHHYSPHTLIAMQYIIVALLALATAHAAVYYETTQETVLSTRTVPRNCSIVDYAHCTIIHSNIHTNNCSKAAIYPSTNCTHTPQCLQYETKCTPTPQCTNDMKCIYKCMDDNLIGIKCASYRITNAKTCIRSCVPTVSNCTTYCINQPPSSNCRIDWGICYTAHHRIGFIVNKINVITREPSFTCGWSVDNTTCLRSGREIITLRTLYYNKDDPTKWVMKIPITSNAITSRPYTLWIMLLAALALARTPMAI
jgi:hypothetical protein